MTATPEATKNYFNRLKSEGHDSRNTVLGSTGLTVSRVGFGTYRMHEFEPEHREALRLALLSGVNIIDTSTNYTDGSSERLIGEITSELFATGKVQRQEIVFVTKVGYLQGTTLKEVRSGAQGEKNYPEMVEFQNDCWHNISPEFIADQITKSLARLKLSKIDVVLLHNPEYFLKTSAQREVYYQRIEKAFKHLEKECSDGRISYYGISSNTFPEAESRSDFTSLARVHEIAKSVSPKSHFAVIQFPFNIYEAGAALHQNNQRQTVFEYAAKANLGVLANRPFNASAKGRLTRLTSFPLHDPVVVKGELHTLLGRAIELERKAPEYPKAVQGFTWAQVLRESLGEMDDLLGWRDVLYNQVLPSIRHAISRLAPQMKSWADEYSTVMDALLRNVTADLENLADQKSALIGEQIVALAPELASSPTLSRKVLRIYESFPQLSCVLVGMRSQNYVKDAVGTENPLSEEQALEVLKRLQRYRS